MTSHYRKDSERGITAPNPYADKDVVQHITKHRGMKTPFTSVSENQKYITHFNGTLYKTDSTHIITDGHAFHSHDTVLGQLLAIRKSATRKDKVIVDRAIMLAKNAKEALVDWRFDLDSIERNDGITFCYKRIQKYFSKV